MNLPRQTRLSRFVGDQRDAVQLFAGILIVVLACIVRLYHITSPVLWMDEAYSVLLARFSVPEILFHVTRDVHPPLYYLLLHYWIIVFGDSLLAVRGLSVVVSAMAIAQRLANRRAALLTGVIFALLPIAVRYSQEPQRCGFSLPWTKQGMFLPRGCPIRAR
ncbi:glycosyltransferase family 39 protein [Pseudomonas sp. TWI628]|uniref:glycosyltransferase family 39 protein n=1 Tax=Pseudomonas sp. TWI628 TaxID=3136788 RepID=UPI003208D04B